MRRSSFTKRSRLVALLIALITIGPAGSDVANATSAADIAHHEGCHFGVIFVDIPMDPVDDMVPETYTVWDSGGGRAGLIVDPFACGSVKVGERPLGRVEGAFVSVQVCSSSDAICLPTLSYLLFLLTDNKAYAEWLRGGSGLSVKYVPGLVHQFTCPPAPCETGDYFFEAPPPSPSLFTVNGVMAAQQVIPATTEGGGWLQETRSPDGKRVTVTLQYNSHADYFASGDVTITAPEGSEMAAIMGTTTAEPFGPSPHWTEPFDLTRTVDEVRDPPS